MKYQQAKIRCYLLFHCGRKGCAIPIFILGQRDWLVNADVALVDAGSSECCAAWWGARRLLFSIFRSWRCAHHEVLGAGCIVMTVGSDRHQPISSCVATHWPTRYRGKKSANAPQADPPGGSDNHVRHIPVAPGGCAANTRYCHRRTREL